MGKKPDARKFFMMKNGDMAELVDATDLSFLFEPF